MNKNIAIAASIVYPSLQDHRKQQTILITFIYLELFMRLTKHLGDSLDVQVFNRSLPHREGYEDVALDRGFA